MAADHEHLIGLIARDLAGPRPLPSRFEDWKRTRKGEDEFRESLVEQVGPRWTGLDDLSHIRRDYVSDLMADLPDDEHRAQAVSRAGHAHAYETGVILTLMALQRPDGRRIPRPPAGDATLTAMAASFGRPTPFVEALGAVAHWMAERRAGFVIETPTVEVAVSFLAWTEIPETPKPPRPSSIWAP